MKTVTTRQGKWFKKQVSEIDLTWYELSDSGISVLLCNDGTFSLIFDDSTREGNFDTITRAKKAAESYYVKVLGGDLDNLK